jgi:hypothetical protein
LSSACPVSSKAHTRWVTQAAQRAADLEKQQREQLLQEQEMQKEQSQLQHLAMLQREQVIAPSPPCT